MIEDSGLLLHDNSTEKTEEHLESRCREIIFNDIVKEEREKCALDQKSSLQGTPYDKP